MFKFKITISVIIFSVLLIATSAVKNQTRKIEKNIFHISKEINKKQKDLNESQLDFSYLTSPSIIEKIEHLDKYEYLPMEHSKYLNISDFINLQNKFVTRENQMIKKIKKNKNFNKSNKFFFRRLSRN